jgi:hypothetical protein
MKIPIPVSRFAWKEFLRGPLGTPIVLARNIRPVGRLMPVRQASLRVWRRISALPFSTGARKAIYRALWVLPFGPGDAATLPRVVKRHREFFRSRAAHA